MLLNIHFIIPTFFSLIAMYTALTETVISLFFNVVRWPLQILATLVRVALMRHGEANRDVRILRLYKGCI